MGMTNSRMKDFYDLDFLLGKFDLEETILREAVRRTFARRGTALPEGEPQVFQPEFEEQKEVLWRQFLERNELNVPDLEFGKVLQMYSCPVELPLQLHPQSSVALILPDRVHLDCAGVVFHPVLFCH